MTQPTASRLRLPAEWPLLLPALLLVAVVIAWIATGGGYESQPALGAPYEPDPWYLGALALVGVSLATAFGLGRVRLSRFSRLACATLAGYVAWSFLSILWAHDQGAALLGSDRALVYLAAFLTFAILPWNSWTARAVLALFAGAVGVVAIITAVKVATLADPGALYVGERLAYPLGYYNADASLYMTAAIVAIALAAQRSGPGVLRVLGVLVAAVCLQLAVLSQSRGWLYTAPIVLLFTLVLIPGRLRLLAYVLLPAAVTGAIAPVLLRVYAKAAPNGVALAQPALSHVLHQQGSKAVHAMLLADIVLAVLATAVVAFDRRVELSRPTQQRINRIAGVVAAIAILVAITGGLVAVHGRPVARVERAWHSFADTGGATTGYSRFSTFASNRADIWRVALHEFSEHPLTGIGQDNFATAYTRLRHTYEAPRWTHSIELRLLTHTGLIGALLFLAFLLASLLAALRGGRGHLERVTAGILLLPLVVWLIHGSIDWFWEYPALSVPALAFLAAAGALARTPAAEVPQATGAGRSMRTAAWVGVAVAGACALGALVVPFLAARRLEHAMSVWPQNPALAYSEVNSASNLMPFDAQIYLVGGSIAVNSEEYDRARSWFLQAERHENQGWLTPFALALTDSEQGLRPPARSQLRRARALNPREPVIVTALERLDTSHPLTFAEAQEMLAQHITTPPV